jgi:ATP-dependent metalloprotease FtsH
MFEKVFFLMIIVSSCKGFFNDLENRHQLSRPLYKKMTNPFGNKYKNELMNSKKADGSTLRFKYPVSKLYFEEQLKRLNSHNITLSIEEEEEEEEEEKSKTYLYEVFGIEIADDDNRRPITTSHTRQLQPKKSENFEVVKNNGFKFEDVGGYDNVKNELTQCLDILKNYQKYRKYNVRIPKGLILEGPPGTGKTLFAKALAGESGCAFIAVSGSDFQEKYVGIGSSRIKEVFKLANQNIPCIIFIDEIDAVGRKRSSDGESSSNERDSTLNALLVELDGFKNNTGIFLIAATNRIDLLDNALTRPGRIDKKIFIGLPDSVTRKAILEIHMHGKPHESSIKIDELVLFTEGLTGAQIENLLNEAMLNALRHDRTKFTYKDFDLVLNKMMVGWQPNEHEFSSDIIDHIAIHEMGHAIVGIFSKHHSKMTKVIINLSSPKSPGYTVFESSTSNIYTRESLFEHIMILLSGRIAEEIFYGISVTTGALNDFEEALKLAEKMVIHYGMGTNVIYPSSSNKYKELIDKEVNDLIQKAYSNAETILRKSKKLIQETSELLKRDKYLDADIIHDIIDRKHSYLKEYIWTINEKK